MLSDYGEESQGMSLNSNGSRVVEQLLIYPLINIIRHHGKSETSV
jgi:hypothetical protein